MKADIGVNPGVATPRLWDAGLWDLHEILLYPIMRRNMR